MEVRHLHRDVSYINLNCTALDVILLLLYPLNVFKVERVFASSFWKSVLIVSTLHLAVSQILYMT